MGSLKDFQSRIKIIGRNIEVNSAKAAQQCALAIDQTVVTSTPVDEGRARSNWIVAISSPARNIIDPYTPGSKGSTGGANAQAAIDQGKGVISSRKNGEDIYISNNLPYISKLNAGSSAQAPANFIEKAIQSGIRALRSVKIVK